MKMCIKTTSTYNDDVSRAVLIVRLNEREEEWKELVEMSGDESCFQVPWWCTPHSSLRVQRQGPRPHRLYQLTAYSKQNIQLKNFKVKDCVQHFAEFGSKSYGASPTIWDHTVLSTTTTWTRPALIPARQTSIGIRFGLSHSRGMEGWVDLGVNYNVYADMLYLSAQNRLSYNSDPTGNQARKVSKYLCKWCVILCIFGTSNISQTFTLKAETRQSDYFCREKTNNHVNFVFLHTHFWVRSP